MNSEKSAPQKRLAGLKDLPTLPQILLKLIKICNDSERDFKELSEILEKDPSLSIKILKMVNSPYYGLSRKVENILQAVTILGSNAIRNIAVCASVHSVFNQREKKNDFKLKTFWWHSLKSAVLARRMAENRDDVDGDEAFLSGLLHDIGKVVLWTNFGREYALLLEEYRDRPWQCLKAETEIFINHCLVGAWLLKRWHFRSFMADAVLYHHDAKDRISTALPLVQVVYLANIFSQKGVQENPDGMEMAESILGMGRADVEDHMVQAEEEAKIIAQSLGIEIASPNEKSASAPDGDESARGDLRNMVKDVSLLFGTLRNMLQAENSEALLKTLEQDLQVLFDVENVIFFMVDPELKCLTGKTFSGDRDLNRVNRLRIPLKMRESLLNRCLANRRPMDSFEHSNPENRVLLDEQIIRLLGSEGMVSIPMHVHETDVGVMVLGLDSAAFLNLTKAHALLKLYSGQAALALYVDQMKQNRFQRLQAERIKAYSALSGKVAHEVKTPLSIIKNYISILKRRLSEDLSAQEELGLISEETDRVTHILGVFSDFSKFEDVTVESVNINQTVSGLAKVLIKSRLIGSGIGFHLNLDQDLPRIQTDKNKLKQILINLVRNAVEAMPGGGNIHIQTHYGKNSLDTLVNPKTGMKLDYAEIRIKDDGPGIHDLIKPGLFDAHVSTKGAGHHGLGLSIVYSLVKALNGTIGCESDAQKGTCFKIVLPFD